MDKSIKRMAVIAAIICLVVVPVAYGAIADSRTQKVKLITAQNQFTAEMNIIGIGVVVVEDTSSISATIRLQVKPDQSTTWIDTGDTFTAEGAWAFDGSRGNKYRVGVKTGDFSSGTATVYLIQATNTR